jgi:hypothetical protein
MPAGWLRRIPWIGTRFRTMRCSGLPGFLQIFRVVTLLVAGPAAFAQAHRPWIDPPADLGAREGSTELRGRVPARAETAPVEPPPPAAAATRPEPRDRLEAREQAARELAISYLASWSTNPVTLESTLEFYAPRVAFHGRMISARALFQQKRRFARRWPERQYHHRPETIQVACDPEGDVCTVRSIIDFVAANPRARRRSQGSASFELVVSFTGERPVIVSENSLVRPRSRSTRLEARENATDE